MPSDILRRRNSSSRKNKLHFGFRELGRVVRTIFLLRYLSDAELRRTIQAATNKSERFNQFVQWVSFRGDVEIDQALSCRATANSLITPAGEIGK
jgi:TnpA family transposase